MAHSHGKKRRAYKIIGGHRFAQEKRAHPKREAKQPSLGYAEKSLCGLTVFIAESAAVDECERCKHAAKQMWA